MRTGLLLLLLLPRMAVADAGVLIPSNRQQPDPAVLSLAEMLIDVRIDNGDARVSIRQIFESRHNSPLEGTYLFSLPGRAAVSDFAVWDDVTRIPGVILERRRAEEIYNELRAQAIDPGLLQQGEHEITEARRTSIFSAKIVPIPAFGTKRLEMEYHERIPLENLSSLFAIPLRPDAYHAQTAGFLRIVFELRSAHPIAKFAARSKAYPLQLGDNLPNVKSGVFEGRNVALTEDFAVEYALAPPRAPQLAVLAHRDPSQAGEPGYFQASALLPAAAAPGSSTGAPRTVTILFDASLSMQWEKLERNYQALEKLLFALAPSDRFNLILFNSEPAAFTKSPVSAGAPAAEKALQFVRAATLRGATNLVRALEAAFAQTGAQSGEQYLVLLGDGAPTEGTINNSNIASWYAGRWQKIPAARRPRTFVFAVGDDANVPLLKLLASHDGVIEHVRSTEPIEFKLNAFLGKIGRRPIDGLTLTTAPAANFDLVYPLETTVFPGADASWVGQYKNPAPRAEFTVRGRSDRGALEARATVPLPAESLDHPGLPRTWARARVDALLAKIEREGEDRASIDEIIRLSRKYKFVTPYTSFLAAPRALLRPRLIRPGDPLLRVKTDPSVVSVTALFPFGPVKTLRYLAGEDVWQTRFLAPKDLADGTYPVRLVLRDRAGRVSRESKTFVIASKPPLVRVKLDKARYRRGEAVRLRAAASDTTRTIFARMYGVPRVSLRWNPKENVNTGEFFVPDHLPAGKYVVTVTAEDFAHNIGSREVSLEVAP